MQTFETSSKDPKQGYYMQHDPAFQTSFEKKFMFLNQLQKDNSGSGQCFVILCSMIFIAVSVGLGIFIANSDYYGALSATYQLFYGRFSFSIMMNHLNDSCGVVLMATLAAPYCLAFFAGFNLLNTLFACCGTTCFLWLQVSFGMAWGGIAAFFAANNCLGNIGEEIGKSLSGTLPQNGWPYYAGMAGLSIFSALAQYCWSTSKARVQMQQKSLALLMAH